MIYYNYIDFETRSEADLKAVGAANYAEHPSTDIICLAFCTTAIYNRQPVFLITRADLQIRRQTSDRNQWSANLRALYDMAADPNCIFVAHNAAFERYIWKNIMVERYGFPDIPIHRWKCTMAKCYSLGLPGALKEVGPVLELTHLKDIEGSEAMLFLSKPMPVKFQKQYGCTFWEPEFAPPGIFEKCYEYCKGDILCEIELDTTTMDLSPEEKEMWCIDQEINSTGVYLDLPVIRKATAIVTHEKGKIRKEFSAVTGFNPSQHAELQKYLNDKNIPVPNTTKDTLLKVARNINTPVEIVNLLELAGKHNKSSLAKIGTMVRRSTNLGLLREMFQFHGAHTGRWAGRGVQLQNLPRPKVNSDLVISCIRDFSYDFFQYMFPNINEALSSSLRGMIIPHTGDRFLLGDLKQMERLMLAWLAGCQKSLDDFIADVDCYTVTASGLFGYDISGDKEKRQVGKVTELACQYGGGIGSFVSMAKNYDFDITILPGLILPTATQAEIDKGNYDYDGSGRYSYMYRFAHSKEGKAGAKPISREVGIACSIVKERWRAANPEIVAYWKRLNNASIAAVQTGKPQEQDGLLWFLYDRFLVCKLHSGRHIFYPFPRVDGEDNPTLTYMRKDPDTGKWLRTSTYGGKQAENVTQAEQSDILREGMRRLRSTIYKIVMHVHDEWVCSVKRGLGTIEEFKQILEVPMACYPGLPIRVDVQECERYRK